MVTTDVRRGSRKREKRKERAGQTEDETGRTGEGEKLEER